MSQSAIVSKWFKGKELAMALGMNISISRLGSVINGIVLPKIYNEDHTDLLGLALLVGFMVCLFSLACAIALVIMDKKADVHDGIKDNKFLSEDEKFKFSDIKTFNLSFWLICASCVVTYCTIFPYIQVASDMLQKKFKVDNDTAGSLYTMPYTISACTSPFMGFAIDRFGKRVILSNILSY